jgi:hypothetical protein
LASIPPFDKLPMEIIDMIVSHLKWPIATDQVAQLSQKCYSANVQAIKQMNWQSFDRTIVGYGV